MEKNIAILIADLSGYTALTETHGAESAADLIDTFLRIVKDCLVGQCRLRERTGDEVMIISACPDDLLSTAINIMHATTSVDNFLLVHGGLHYGKILERNNSYFGTTINLTARIAAKAGPGTFWCSDDFINALSDKNTRPLLPKGKFSFKNLNKQIVLSEVMNNANSGFAIDPVCRMLILDKAKAVKHNDHKEHHFCSHTCLELFMKRQVYQYTN